MLTLLYPCAALSWRFMGATDKPVINVRQKPQAKVVFKSQDQDLHQCASPHYSCGIGGYIHLLQMGQSAR